MPRQGWLCVAELMVAMLFDKIAMDAVDRNQEGMADVSEHGLWQVTGQSKLWHSSCVRM